MKKKLLILSLLFLLLTAFLTAGVSAEPRDGTFGRDGNNLTWSLDANGLLTVSGTGNMGFTSWGDMPWYNCKTSIKTVVLGDGVTDIGTQAFEGCTALTSVTIPSSVTTIESGAFSGCSALTSVTVPSGVTVIGYGAFSDCSALASVTLASSVTTIESGAFSRCSALASVTIPSGVTSIGAAAFSDCPSLASITVNAGNTAFSAVGNCLIENASKTLILGCKNSVIPTDGSVTSIGRCAFQGCSGLTAITIPSSVTTLCWNAFADCTGITSLNIPSSVTSIEDYVLIGCSALRSLTIPFLGSRRDNPPAGESRFGHIFGYNENVPASLNTVVISEGATSIGNGAFSDCAGITSVTIPSTVTTIGKSAFSGCSGLTSLTIPSGVTTIGGGALYGCTNLTSLTVPFLGYSAESYWDAKLVDFFCDYGNGKRSCPSALSTVVIGEGAIGIGYQAFADWTSLTSVTIPSSVTTIDWGAFSGCTGLASLDIPFGVTTIGKGAFEYTKITDLTIPASVTHLDNGVFNYCSELKSVTFEAPTLPIPLVPRRVTICGLKGSTAEAYANANFCQFVAIEPQTFSFHPSRPATCTEPGNIAYYTSDRDGKYYSDAEGRHAITREDVVLPATGHTFDEGTVRNGKTVYICTVCGATDTDGSVSKVPAVVIGIAVGILVVSAAAVAVVVLKKKKK